MKPPFKRTPHTSLRRVQQVESLTQSSPCTGYEGIFLLLEWAYLRKLNSHALILIS
nr:MAG TPA: hypothetical protein [Caudoviricetes sp.]